MLEDQNNKIQKELKKVREYLEKGEVLKANALFSEIIGKYSNYLPAILECANFLLSLDFPLEALEVLRKGFKISPNDFQFRYLWAIALQKGWFLNLAEKEFEFLKKERPGDLEIERQIGWTKVLKGEIEEGRRILREVINLDLTNPWPYMDLGSSYGLALDFKEALKWLEIAKSLAGKDPLILERIEDTKKLEKEFEKLPAEEREKVKRMRKDPQSLKAEAIRNMLSLSAKVPITKEMAEDIKRELELAGFSPQLIEFTQPETKRQKIVKEYMDYHFKIENVERKISKKEFKALKRKLFDKEIGKEEIKKILLIFAHQGTKEAISLLEEYSKIAEKDLLEWVKLALKECKIFSKAKPGQIIKIFH